MTEKRYSTYMPNRGDLLNDMVGANLRIPENTNFNIKFCYFLIGPMVVACVSIVKICEFCSLCLLCGVYVLILIIHQLKRIEAEAQERMRQEIEDRRKQLLKLREENLEKKKHLETIKRNQAYTKPWVFSYYVKWPRDTYER